MENIHWEKIKVVIFDVDGTLYLQSKLRKKMILNLMRYYFSRPWKIHELRILQQFRRSRESNTSFSEGDLENSQYLWCAEKLNYPLSRVKQVVDHWMFNEPNQYLAECVYPGLKEFFSLLKINGIKIAIYSDYKAEEKLKAMDLYADLVVASTDPHVDRLKPNPDGLLYIARKLSVSPKECLFIGDRPELDGKCAERAGMPYLIVDKKPLPSFNFYTNINKDLLARYENLVS